MISWVILLFHIAVKSACGRTHIPAWVFPKSPDKLRVQIQRNVLSTENEDIFDAQKQIKDSFLDPYYRSEDLPLRPATVETAADYPSSSDQDGLLLPGRHKYLGGAVDSDGCIYGIPSHARSVICLKTFQDDAAQVQTIPLPESIAGGKYKWLRGILAHGYLYGIPAWANSVLQVDVDALWGRRPANGDLVKLLPLPEAHIPGQRWQWHGAALNVNKTAIYAIPSNANRVLKIDLETHTTSFIPIDIPKEYTNFRFEHTNKWYVNDTSARSLIIVLTSKANT